MQQWKTLTRERVVEFGKYLTVERRTIELPDGRIIPDWPWLTMPDYVNVVAVTADDQFVCFRQVKYAVTGTSLAIVGGYLEPGEDPLAAAQRELREETGYRATHWARAGVMHPVIAYSTEYIDVWFAQGLQAGARALDAGEFLEVFELPAPDLLRACLDGSVTDAKTLVGALWLQNYLQGQVALDWQVHAIGDADA